MVEDLLDDQVPKVLGQPPHREVVRLLQVVRSNSPPINRYKCPSNSPLYQCRICYRPSPYKCRIFDSPPSFFYSPALYKCRFFYRPSSYNRRNFYSLLLYLRQLCIGKVWCRRYRIYGTKHQHNPSILSCIILRFLDLCRRSSRSNSFRICLFWFRT